MPSFVQKRLVFGGDHRVDHTLTAGGTGELGEVTFWRSSRPSSSIFVTPSDQYTVDFCERSRSFVTVFTV